jgi:hypothetical protein
MGRYWRLIGHITGESQTFEAAAGALQTSPYVPDERCNLRGIRVITGAEAATSLVEGVQIRLSCTGWKPNVMHVASTGNGLQTVPATAQLPYDYEVAQPCEPGVGITVESRHTIATAVTANLMVMGYFES